MLVRGVRRANVDDAVHANPRCAVYLTVIPNDSGAIELMTERPRSESRWAVDERRVIRGDVVVSATSRIHPHHGVADFDVDELRDERILCGRQIHSDGCGAGLTHPER